MSEHSLAEPILSNSRPPLTTRGLTAHAATLAVTSPPVTLAAISPPSTQRRTLGKRQDRRRGDDVDGVTADFPPGNVDADKDAFGDDVDGATAYVAPENVDAEKASFPIGHNEIAATKRYP